MLVIKLGLSDTTVRVKIQTVFALEAGYLRPDLGVNANLRREVKQS